MALLQAGLSYCIPVDRCLSGMPAATMSPRAFCTDCTLVCFRTRAGTAASAALAGRMKEGLVETTTYRAFGLSDRYRCSAYGASGTRGRDGSRHGSDTWPFTDFHATAWIRVRQQWHHFQALLPRRSWRLRCRDRRG